MSKDYFNHIITLSDGSKFVDARTDHRTPDALNRRAQQDYATFEVWAGIKEYPVVKTVQVGGAKDKTTALADKQAIIEALAAEGLRVRNNPKTESHLKIA